MPAEGEPIGSCGGAPGNGPAYPRADAPAYETGPIRGLVGEATKWVAGDIAPLVGRWCFAVQASPTHGV